MLGLAVVVCTVTLLGLTPWQPKESVPQLEQPAFEARVGDAVEVPTVGPAVAVVQAAVAPGRAELVSHQGGVPSEREGPEGGAPTVGPAFAVAAPAGNKTGAAPSPAPSPENTAPAEVPPAAAPAPELASVPATPPTSSPVAKTPGGPVSAGGPESPGEAEEELGEGPGEEESGAGEEEACVGDEYTLTITSLEAGGEAVTIVLEHLVADGSTETLELEGDLEDARSLVLQLSAEGGCVEVKVVSPAPAAPPVPDTP